MKKCSKSRTDPKRDPKRQKIARIENPFSLGTDLPQLRIGQPLRAKIEGVTLEDVFVIPRTAMRDINRIFLIDKDGPKISKTDITPVWSNNEVVIVKNGLNPGDWLATSRLSYAPDEAPVEIIEPASSGEAAGSADQLMPEGSFPEKNKTPA